VNAEDECKDRIANTYSTFAADVLKLFPSSEYQEVVVDYVEAEGRLRPRLTVQPSPRKAYNAISADRWFVCPAQRLAEALSGSQSEFVGRFLYTHVLSGRSIYYGASNSYDLPFVFGSFGAYEVAAPTADELALKAKFQETWADFARSDNPADFWDRYDAKRGNYVVFNTPVSSGTQWHTKQCDFWYPPDQPAVEIPKVPVGNHAKPSGASEEPLPPHESYGGNQ